MMLVDARPKISGNVEKSVLFHRSDGDVYCIGTRQTDKYVTAPECDADAVYETMRLIDGTRTLEEIQSLSDQRSNIGSKVDVERLYKICEGAGLTERSDKTVSSRAHDELDLMLVDLKTFGLSKLYPVFKVVASTLPIAVLIMVMIDAVACAMFGLSGESVPWNALLGDPRVILYAWIIQVPSIIMHEFAHAAVAYKYGIRPKSLSFCIFYYCSLAFYVRIPGIYLKKEKERVAIWSAGIFTNICIASLFLLLYLCSTGQMRLFASVGVIVNLGMALGNVMPFFYSDGYYILSTLLKTPNLRKKSLFGFKSLISEKPTKNSLVYWTYLFVTVGVVVAVVGVQLVTIGGSIVGDAATGMTVVDMATKYFNVAMIVVLGLVAKTVSSIQKRRRQCI